MSTTPTNDDATPEPPPVPPGAPTGEKLDLWIRQNRAAARRGWLSIIGVALVLAVVSAVAVENALVLNRLNERGQSNREMLTEILAISEDTQRTRDVADRIDSPEQRAAQAKATQDLLDALTVRIDCNTRTALLDAIADVFGREAAAEYRSKIESLCPPSPPPGGSTTTTTP